MKRSASSGPALADPGELLQPDIKRIERQRAPVERTPGGEVAAAGFEAATPYATAQRPVLLTMDASRAADGIMEVRERIPARPGDFTVVYPKWIPGEHGPTGPLGLQYHNNSVSFRNIWVRPVPVVNEP